MLQLLERPYRPTARIRAITTNGDAESSGAVTSKPHQRNFRVRDVRLVDGEPERPERAQPARRQVTARAGRLRCRPPGSRAAQLSQQTLTVRSAGRVFLHEQM